MGLNFFLYINNRKGVELSLTAIIVFAILVVVAVIIIGFLIKGGSLFGKTTEELSPKQDALCIASTKTKALTYSIKDTDSDGRDDQSCDWCVCTTGCHNDDDDRDGDKLPDKCDDAADNIDITKFNKNNCPESSLVKLAGKNMQCRPS